MSAAGTAPGRDSDGDRLHRGAGGAPKSELRDYYAEPAHPRGGGRSWLEGHGIGPAMRRVVKQMGSDGWLGIGWPTEYGGQGRSAIEQFIFFDESMRSGAPVPMLTINTVGPDHHAVRHARSRRSSSCPRSWRARSTSASATPSRTSGTDLASLTDPSRARRRRVRHQRREDLHQPGRRRRLHLAGHPDRPRRAPSTRASRSSSSRWTRRASRSCRCSSSATTTSTTRSTRTSGCRPPTWSAARTTAGR